MDAKPKVLIIEDNVDLLAILQQVLSPDYEVATARRGEDGVSLAMSLRPDVVILDLQLPQMSGLEAGLWIKREVGDVPILVLTALTGTHEVEIILQSGCCDAYMSKPAPLDAIRAKVSELLRSGTSAAG